MADINVTIGGDVTDLDRAINSVFNQPRSLGRINARNFEQPLGRITGKASEFQKSLEAANARVLAFGASAGAIFAVKKAFDSLIGSSASVEKSLTDINVLLRLNSKDLSRFGRELFLTANRTGVAFKDAASAAAEFSRQGLSAEDTLKRTEAALSLARISGLGFEESVQSLTAAINSFKKESLTAIDIVNRLAAVDEKFAVSSEDLAKGIQRVGSSASDANVTLNQTIALVTAAQQTTARGGAVIGNSFKTIFTRLQRPKTLEALESLGIATKQASGEILPLVDILKSLASRFDTLSSSQKSFVAEAVGGVFQINVLKAVLSDLGGGISVYDGALKAASNSTGLARQRTEELNQTLSAKFLKTLNSVSAASASIGSLTFAPTIKGGLDFATNFADSVTKSIEQEDFGGKITKVLSGAFSGFLSGPGVRLLAVGFGKLITQLGSFAGRSIAEFAQLNESARRRAAVEQTVLDYMSRETTLIGQLYNGQISIEQAASRVASQLRQQNALLEYQRTIAGQIANQLPAKGLRVSATSNMASGFVPNFASEKDLAREHGYTAGRVYERKIYPGDGRGGRGKPFTATVNSAETIKDTPVGTFVVPPNGFARGLIPNLANFEAGANEMFGPSPSTVLRARVWQMDYEAQQREEREFEAQQREKAKKNRRRGAGKAKGFLPNFEAGANEMFGPSPSTVLRARVWQMDYEAQQREEREFEAQQREKAKKNRRRGAGKAKGFLPNFEAGAKGTLPDFDYFYQFEPNKKFWTLERKRQKKQIPSTQDIWTEQEPVAIKQFAQLLAQKYGYSDIKTTMTRNLRSDTGGSGVSFTGFDAILEALTPQGVKQNFLASVKTGSNVPAEIKDINAKVAKAVSGESYIKALKGEIIKVLLARRGGMGTGTVAKWAKEKALASGFVPNFALKLLDRDYLMQQTNNSAKQSEQIFNEIVAKANSAGKLKEIIAGAPGAGKTTLAMSMGATPISSASQFDPANDELIAVRSILAASSLEKPENQAFFGGAQQIKMLRASGKVAEKMRKKRDAEIASGTSKTGFGRKAGSTRGATTDTSVMEALLNEKYPGKLTAFQRNEDFSLSEVKDIKTIKDLGGVSVLTGNFGPMTKGHEKLLDAATKETKVIYVSGSETNRDFGLGFSAEEKMKMIQKQFPDAIVLPLDRGTQNVFNYEGQVYRTDPKKSQWILGGDRDVPKYTNRAPSIGELTVVPRPEGSESATNVRKSVVEDDSETLRAGVSDKIFESLSSNLETLQKRGSLIQQRKDKALPRLLAAQKELDDFIAVNGNRKKPKEDSSITETRNALKEKVKKIEKRISGKFKSGVFGRMGLGMNLASGFMPNFAANSGKKAAKKTAEKTAEKDAKKNPNSNVRLSYGGETGETIKDIFKSRKHTQTSRVADDFDTIKNIQFEMEELGDANEIFKQVKEIALTGTYKQIAEYLKIGDIDQWLENRESKKENVLSLTKKEKEINKTRQLTGVVSAMAGEYYEQLIASQKGLKKSGDESSRLDFYQTEKGKEYLAEAKLGKYTLDNLVSKGIETVAQRDTKLKNEERTNYKGSPLSGGNDTIPPLEDSIKLFVPKKPRTKRITELASGFVPNFSEVTRAMATERKAGKGAELRYDEKIGPYVAQPSQPKDLSSLIKKDHPEGLSQAIANSAKSQGLAKGFLPNFASFGENLGLGLLQGMGGGAIDDAAIKLFYKSSARAAKELEKTNNTISNLETSMALLKARGMDENSQQFKTLKSRAELLGSKAETLAKEAAKGKEDIEKSRNTWNKASFIISSLAGAVNQSIPENNRYKEAIQGLSGSLESAASVGATLPGPLGTFAAVATAAYGAFTFFEERALAAASQMPELLDRAKQSAEAFQKLTSSTQQFTQAQGQLAEALKNGVTDVDSLARLNTEVNKAITEVAKINPQLAERLKTADQKEQQVIINQVTEEAGRKKIEGERVAAINKTIIQNESFGRTGFFEDQKDTDKQIFNFAKDSLFGSLDQKGIESATKALEKLNADGSNASAVFGSLEDSLGADAVESLREAYKRNAGAISGVLANLKYITKNYSDQRKAAADLIKSNAGRIASIRLLKNLNQSLIDSEVAKVKALRQSQLANISFIEDARATATEIGNIFATQKAQDERSVQDKFVSDSTKLFSSELGKLQSTGGKANEVQSGIISGIQKTLASGDISKISNIPRDINKQLINNEKELSQARLTLSRIDETDKKAYNDQKKTVDELSLTNKTLKEVQNVGLNQLRDSARQAAEQSRKLDILREIKTDLGQQGGIDTFIDRSKGRSDQRDLGRSISRAFGSGSSETRARGSIQLFRNLQTLIGSENISQESRSALRGNAAAGLEKSIRKNLTRAISRLQRKGAPEAVISDLRKQLNRSGEIAQRQLDAELKTQQMPYDIEAIKNNTDPSNTTQAFVSALENLDLEKVFGEQQAGLKGAIEQLAPKMSGYTDSIEGYTTTLSNLITNLEAGIGKPKDVKDDGPPEGPPQGFFDRMGNELSQNGLKYGTAIGAAILATIITRGKGLGSQIGAGFGGGGLGLGAATQTKAKGYIPNAFSAEEAKAKSLGASSNVKAHWGKGTIKGKPFLMNNQEMEIPRFGGGRDSAVIPMYYEGTTIRGDLSRILNPSATGGATIGGERLGNSALGKFIKSAKPNIPPAKLSAIFAELSKIKALNKGIIPINELERVTGIGRNVWNQVSSTGLEEATRRNNTITRNNARRVSLKSARAVKSVGGMRSKMLGGLKGSALLSGVVGTIEEKDELFSGDSARILAASTRIGGRVAFSGAGTAIGTGIGMVAGMGFGSLLGPAGIAVGGKVGAWLGGIAGGIIGDAIGKEAGDVAGKEFFGYSREDLREKQDQEKQIREQQKKLEKNKERKENKEKLKTNIIEFLQSQIPTSQEGAEALYENNFAKQDFFKSALTDFNEDGNFDDPENLNKVNKHLNLLISRGKRESVILDGLTRKFGHAEGYKKYNARFKFKPTTELRDPWGFNKLSEEEFNEKYPAAAASGYLPPNVAATEEKMARSLGAGFGVKAHWGKGTINGKRFVMNNRETEIPNFGGGRDSAVIPRYAEGTKIDTSSMENSLSQATASLQESIGVSERTAAASETNASVSVEILSQMQQLNAGLSQLASAMSQQQQQQKSASDGASKSTPQSPGQGKFAGFIPRTLSF